MLRFHCSCLLNNYIDLFLDFIPNEIKLKFDCGHKYTLVLSKNTLVKYINYSYKQIQFLDCYIINYTENLNDISQNYDFDNLNIYLKNKTKKDIFNGNINFNNDIGYIEREIIVDFNLKLIDDKSTNELDIFYNFEFFLNK